MQKARFASLSCRITDSLSEHCTCHRCGLRQTRRIRSLLPSAEQFCHREAQPRPNFTLKPTAGRLPRPGLKPLACSKTHGAALQQTRGAWAAGSSERCPETCSLRHGAAASERTTHHQAVVIAQSPMRRPGLSRSPCARSTPDGRSCACRELPRRRGSSGTARLHRRWWCA